jgi:hypothetical protein
VGDLLDLLDQPVPVAGLAGDQVQDEQRLPPRARSGAFVDRAASATAAAIGFFVRFRATRSDYRRGVGT